MYGYTSSCLGDTIVMTDYHHLLGNTGSFTFTYNFDVPVNNLSVFIIGMGSGSNEDFTFTTDTGTPTITSPLSCYTTISGNTIIGGSGTPTPPPFVTGGGKFIITNSTPFNTMTITGNGGSAGSALNICSDSIVPMPSVTPTQTPSVTPSVTLSVTPSVTPSATPTLGVSPSTTPSVTPTITPSTTPTSSVTPSFTPTITPTITQTITSTIRVFYTDCNGSPTTLNIVQGDSGCVCGTITAIEWADASGPPSPQNGVDYSITYGTCP
jgi:hypothetical protein